jgi:hypothetical protein
MKKIALGCLVVAGLVFGSAGAAVAGEYNGAGGDAKGGENAKSLCAFSGLDRPDNQEGPMNRPDDDITIHGVQSYGQYVSQGFKESVPSPGVLCKGNLGGE